MATAHKNQIIIILDNGHVSVKAETEEKLKEMIKMALDAPK